MTTGQTDFLDVLEPDADDAAPAAPTPEPAPPPTEPQGQPRDGKGRFATKADEPDEPDQQGVKPEAQPAPAAEPPSAETSPTVPRAALEDERKKRQALEAELAKLKQPAPPAQTPTQSSPPEKRTRGIQRPEIEYDEQNPRAYFEQSRYWDRLETSWEFAVTQSSEEEMQEAWDAFEAACASDPQTRAWSFSDELRNSRHPMGEVLKWRRNQKRLARFNEIGDVDAYIEAEIAKRMNGGAQHAPAAVAPAPRPASAAQSPPTPPPSLARGGNGQGDAPELPNEDEDFKSFFRDLKKPRNR